MFEYIFPIFCFGVIITGIVAKGMMTAADMARSEAESDDVARSAPTPSRFTPIANELGRSRRPQFQPHPSRARRR